jgi:hypothetical protein
LDMEMKLRRKHLNDFIQKGNATCLPFANSRAIETQQPTT